MIDRVLASNYRVVEKVGEGGMGAVYRAVDVMLERDVAIKAIRPELSRDPDMVERFRTEARSLARVSHPAIATIYSFFLDGGELFLAMEFVRGRSLARVLETEGALPWDRAVRLLDIALDGIAEAHRAGIIHRDLKPDNLMITDTGSVKVTDFGIARMAGTSHLTRTGLLVGTLRFMAPEQIQGEEADARSDIYSLGAVFYQMLSGRQAFDGKSDYAILKAQIEEMPPPPSEVAPAPGIPGWLDRAVLRALAKAPADRFQSIEAMQRFLRSQGMDDPADPADPGRFRPVSLVPLEDLEDLPTIVTPPRSTQPSVPAAAPPPVLPIPPVPPVLPVLPPLPASGLGAPTAPSQRPLPPPPPLPSIPPVSSRQERRPASGPPPIPTLASGAPPAGTDAGLYQSLPSGSKRSGGPGWKLAVAAAGLVAVLTGVGLAVLTRDEPGEPAAATSAETPAGLAPAPPQETDGPSVMISASDSSTDTDAVVENSANDLPEPTPRPRPTPAGSPQSEAPAPEMVAVYQPPTVEPDAASAPTPETAEPDLPAAPIEELRRLGGEIEASSGHLLEAYQAYLTQKEEAGGEITDHDEELEEWIESFVGSAESLNKQIQGGGFLARLRRRGDTESRPQLGKRVKELANDAARIEALMAQTQPSAEVRRAWQELRLRGQRVGRIAASLR